MNPLESAILNFDNWSHPFTFYDFVIDHHSLMEKDKELFQSIWTTALDSQNWSESDLIIGYNATHNRLTSDYGLNDKAIANVVRAASYQWR